MTVIRERGKGCLLASLSLQCFTLLVLLSPCAGFRSDPSSSAAGSRSGTKARQFDPRESTRYQRKLSSSDTQQRYQLRTRRSQRVAVSSQHRPDLHRPGLTEQLLDTHTYSSPSSSNPAYNPPGWPQGRKEGKTSWAVAGGTASQSRGVATQATVPSPSLGKQPQQRRRWLSFLPQKILSSFIQRQKPFDSASGASPLRMLPRSSSSFVGSRFFDRTGWGSSAGSWEGGVSPSLRDQIQKIPYSELTESDLIAMQTVIDSGLTGPQRDAVADMYWMGLEERDLNAIMEVARLRLTAQSRRKIVSLLAPLKQESRLTDQQRRAFDIVCDMRVNASVCSALTRVASMDLNLETFFILSRVCSWLRCRTNSTGNELALLERDSLTLQEMLSAQVNVSGDVGSVADFLGQEQIQNLEMHIGPYRSISGEMIEDLAIAFDSRINSQQYWAFGQILPLNFNDEQMTTMAEIGELEAALGVTEEQKEMLWHYSSLELTAEQRKQLDLACRIMLDIGPTKAAALRQVSKLHLSPEEKRVFTRLADFRQKQYLLTKREDPFNKTTGTLTMRKVLIQEFKTAIWNRYNSIMDTATNLFPLWTILSAALGMLKPEAFSWFTTEWFTGALATLMLSMGVTLTVGDLIRVASQPVPIAVGFVSCYIIMPLLALGLAKAFQLREALTAGLVLVGSLNGGQSSNLCTYIAKGDVALSILMTLSTTIGATFMIPLISTVLLGESVNLDSFGIALSTIQVFLIPMAAGMAIKKFVPKVVDVLMPLTPVLGVLSTCALVGSAVAQSAPVILAEGIRLQLPCMLIHVFGAIAGYWLMRLFRQDEITSRTGGIETSMKSSALGFLLAKLHFSDYAVRVPPAVSVVWVALMGATIAVAWRQMPIPQEDLDARYNKSKGNSQPPNFLGAYKDHLKFYPLRRPIKKVTDGTKKVIDAAKGSIQATIDDIRIIRETSKLIEKEKPQDPPEENLKPSM